MVSQPAGPLPESNPGELQVQPCGASESDALSRQLSSWGKLWPGDPGSQHSVVRERLTAWLERCMGRGVQRLVTSHDGDLTLSTSTPLLAAFLGRRATRELSRQVLRDL